MVANRTITVLLQLKLRLQVVYRGPVENEKRGDAEYLSTTTDAPTTTITTTATTTDAPTTTTTTTITITMTTVASRSAR